MKKDVALMSHKKEWEKRGFLNWVAGWRSSREWKHRYEGELRLEEEKLVFEGVDKKEGERYRKEISREDVTDIYHGFDRVFRRRDAPSLGTLFGIGFKPLRVSFREGDEERSLYLIIGFNRSTASSNNKEWKEQLEKWVEEGKTGPGAE